MINLNKVVLLVLMLTLISACAAYDKKVVHPPVSESTVCNEPRPQICTREYNPVCATYKNGSEKTGANGCTACSALAVVSYTPGACVATTTD